MSELVAKIKEITSDGIRYWEIRRIIYNAILAGVVIAAGIKEKSFPGIDKLFILFVLAIGANILYCAAYPVDFFVQLSDFQAKWRKYRWILWATGILLASIFAWVMSDDLLKSYRND